MRAFAGVEGAEVLGQQCAPEVLTQLAYLAIDIVGRDGQLLHGVVVGELAGQEGERAGVDQPSRVHLEDVVVVELYPVPRGDRLEPGGPEAVPLDQRIEEETAML